MTARRARLDKGEPATHLEAEARARLSNELTGEELYGLETEIRQLMVSIRDLLDQGRYLDAAELMEKKRRMLETRHKLQAEDREELEATLDGLLVEVEEPGRPIGFHLNDEPKA